MEYCFETVDVFTDVRFDGNPLAVFANAQELTSDVMQALAAELNLSETTFVFPPIDPSNSANIRIFNRTSEMPFAGHPCIGTAFVLAQSSSFAGDELRLEVPAGTVVVELERRATLVIGAKLTAPQPLLLGKSLPADEIASCVGLDREDIDVSNHLPILASVGFDFVIAQVSREALQRCTPSIENFRRVQARHPELGNRFSLHLYAREEGAIDARMFAPLAGTIEDAATGSANCALAGLLLSLATAENVEFIVQQGAAMGRPSTLRITARRDGNGIFTTVAGQCVPVFTGRTVDGSQASDAPNLAVGRSI